MATNPAPGDLELVRAVVNTWDADEEAEGIPDPAELRAWLIDHDLLAAGVRVTAAEHRQAIEVREALRALLLQNAGLDVGPDAGAVLDAAAARARLRVRFAPDGAVSTEAEAGGVAGAPRPPLPVVGGGPGGGPPGRPRPPPAAPQHPAKGGGGGRPPWRSAPTSRFSSASARYAGKIEREALPP